MKESEKASSAKDELVDQLEAAASRNKELCKNAAVNEKEFQVNGECDAKGTIAGVTVTFKVHPRARRCAKCERALKDIRLCMWPGVPEYIL